VKPHSREVERAYAFTSQKIFKTNLNHRSLITTPMLIIKKYDSSTRLASPKTRDARLVLKGRFGFHRERGANFDWRVQNGWLACVEN
jgi:hypothetical protein